VSLLLSYWYSACLLKKTMSESTESVPNCEAQVNSRNRSHDPSPERIGTSGNTVAAADAAGVPHAAPSLPLAGAASMNEVTNYDEQAQGQHIHRQENTDVVPSAGAAVVVRASDCQLFDALGTSGEIRAAANKNDPLPDFKDQVHSHSITAQVERRTVGN
jgi:hypothetical protein